MAWELVLGERVLWSSQVRMSERAVPYLVGVSALIPGAVFCGAPLHGHTAKPVSSLCWQSSVKGWKVKQSQLCGPLACHSCCHAVGVQ